MQTSTISTSGKVSLRKFSLPASLRRSKSNNSLKSKSSQTVLKREFGIIGGIAMVASTQIGSGIFMTPGIGVEFWCKNLSF